MALTAEQMARLDRLLDEALDLDEEGRRRWLQALSVENADLRPALQAALVEGGPSELALPKVPPEQQPFRAGQIVGPYELIRSLGQGGMAQVWLARRADGSIKREVALKIASALHLRGDLAARFEREKDILAALEHPHIARLYDAGVSQDGLPFLAMEYVDGRTITGWCDLRRMTVKERIELFLQVLEAVDYAHGKGVLHRDIKPSNVLVTEDGQVRLLDFGVAKLLAQEDEQAQLTQIYGKALTPEYASPELIKGESIETSSDIYALGVVLYELLSGSRPYDLKSSSVEVLEKAIATVKISPPSTRLTAEAAAARRTTIARLTHPLKGDLDAIVLKTVARRPADRYSTAQSLADDLQRYLDHRPVQARRATPAYRLSKLLLRHKLGSSAALTMVLLLAALGYELFLHHVAPPAASMQNAARSGDVAAGLAAAAPDKSIAVLPFVDMSEKHDQEYFSDGLAEELIGLLAKVPELRVPARTSSFYFKGKSDDIASIARKLRVAHVLEGSVRKSGDKLRVTVQLIRADDGYNTWSQTYDKNLKDVFQVQDEIAGAVVAALRLHLLPSEKITNPFRTNSSEAHDHYLLGMLFWNRADHAEFQRAIKEFREAIKLDPNYAMAYAGLAGAESALADEVGDITLMHSALASAERAIALAPELAEAYAARGGIRTMYLWDWPGARSDLERALDLNPQSAATQGWYSELLVVRGQLPQAVTIARKAVEIDPLSSLNWQRLGIDLEFNGDLGAARRSLEHALELAPESDRARWNLGELEVLDGHAQAALELFQSIHFRATRLYGIALSEEALGRKRESQEALQRLIKDHRHGYAYQIAEVYAFGGEKDAAFEWLERAYSQNDGGLTYLRCDRFLNNLRSDPRFKALLVKMKMAD